MKKYISVILALSSLLLFGCGAATNNATDPTSESSESLTTPISPDNTTATPSDSSTTPAQSPDTTEAPSTAEPLPSLAGTIEMKYDDRKKIEGEIANIKTLSVSSFDTGTEQKDLSIVYAQNGSLVACGVGEALVTTADQKNYLVKVEPATLNLFMILGQSNAEGSTDSASPTIYETARKQSVVCEEGQIYSTYAWSTAAHATWVAGIESSSKLTEESASSFVPKMLSSYYYSRNDTPLEYPLNSLANGGLGKSGIDSALAWEYNRLTGEKVWVVNAAAGSTGIADWIPGGTRYKNAVALMKEVNKTLDDEIAAGHYKLKCFGYFWLQGENDYEQSKEYYETNFRKMHEGFMTDLSGKNGKVQFCGNIIVRSFVQTNDYRDVEDNGPRLAQKALIAANDELAKNIFNACSLNDNWVSVEGVKSHWASKYPKSEYPFTIRSSVYKNPTSIGVVHNGIHYLQPGYNEIGIICADSLFAQK